jgi:hypothetical protein
MSRALDIADLIRTRLLTAPVEGELPTPLDITGVDVIVDRQKDILTEVTKAVSKAKGTAIVILFEGFKTGDEDASRPELEHTYNVCVWSRPIIAGAALPADEVLESVILRLWQWIPEGGPHHHREAQVTNGGLVPDRKFLKYDCEVMIPAGL